MYDLIHAGEITMEMSSRGTSVEEFILFTYSIYGCFLLCVCVVCEERSGKKETAITTTTTNTP